jgi:hypothetical protein
MAMTWTTAVQQLKEEFECKDFQIGHNGNFSITLSAERRIAGESAASDYLVYASELVQYDWQKRLFSSWKNAYLNTQETFPIQTAIYEKNSQIFLVSAVRLKGEECNAYSLRLAINRVAQSLDNASIV